MAYVAIVVNVPQFSMQTMNDKTQTPTKPDDAINLLRNLMDGINAGAFAANVQVTTRATDPGVSTDGDPKSEQFNYNKL